MVGEGSLGERIPSLRLRKCKETARSSGGGQHCRSGRARAKTWVCGGHRCGNAKQIRVPERRIPDGQR